MTVQTETLLNGINVTALQQTIADVTENPSHAIAGFKARTRWQGGTLMQSTIDEWSLAGQRLERNFTINIDEPPELCGGATAPNPQEVLMAALNSCMMVGYVAVCALKGIRLDSLEIESQGELDLRGFLGVRPDVKPGYHDVEYTVRISGDATSVQFEEVHEIVKATSPNFSNFSTAIRLKPTLIVE